MRRRIVSVAAWLAALLALGAAASVVGSERVRSGVAAAANDLAEGARGGIARLWWIARPADPRRMKRVEEISGPHDSATTQLGSSMTCSKVAAALADEPALRGLKLDVWIIGGVVHLEGTVRSEEERELAARVARRASGAELVANDLKVAPRVG